MAQTRTSGPRISPAWIAGLLSGETRCQWASWFKAHYEDWKTVEMPDLSGVDWRVQYTYQLNDCIKTLRGTGLHGLQRRTKRLHLQPRRGSALGQTRRDSHEG